jgi:large subunit ribosomal protein L22
MEVKAITKYARISPLKARDVAREIQGLSASKALDILNFTPRKAARIISKTLKSAIANAEHNFNLNTESLVVKQAVALTGPAFGRIKPMARGSAAPIRKPTAHIQIVLTEGPQ